MIKNDYKEILDYWENTFQQMSEYNVYKKIDIAEIEYGIDWIAKDSKSILDFGCGRGRMAFRCLDKSIDYVYGIDLSNNAVKICKSVAKKFNLEERAKFNCGSFELLKGIHDNNFDGAILSNILDNLNPNDSIEMINEIYRILNSKGKMLLILNPYITKEMKEQYKLKEISEDFYKEETGLYFWNLSDENVKIIIEPYFTIEKAVKVYIKQHGIVNRIYYLKVRK